MRALGWILLVVGLLWAFGGVYNVGAAFMGGVNAPTDAARQQASMATAVSLLLNGLLFILPGARRCRYWRTPRPPRHASSDGRG
jgi:hypothetical protein